MYTRFILCSISLLIVHFSSGQVTDTIARQIASVRDWKLDSISRVIASYEKQLLDLQQNQSNGKTTTNEKINELIGTQKIQEARIKALELQPLTRTSSNGQIAFNELFGLQEKLTTLDIVSKSREFYSELQSITNITEFPEYTDWLNEYKAWSEKSNRNKQVMNIVEASLKIIQDAGNNIPLYGSISQTFVSGVTLLLSELGKKDEKLIAKSERLITTFQFISQFNQLRAQIDHEWKQLEAELEEVKESMKSLQNEQMSYYRISSDRYKNDFLNTASTGKKDQFRKYCNEQISKTHTEKEIAKDPNWMPEVEVYMYKTQALLSRYGNLALKMEKKLEDYDSLLKNEALMRIAPTDLSAKLKSSGIKLNSLIDIFSNEAQAKAFLEFAPVMYISK